MNEEPATPRQPSPAEGAAPAARMGTPDRLAKVLARVPPELRSPSRRERSAAMFTHLLGIFLSFLGGLIFLVFTNKVTRSKFIRFHVMQCVLFHVTLFVLVGTVLLATNLLAFMSSRPNADAGGPVKSGLACLVLLLVPLIILSAWLYPAIAIFQIKAGAHFEYFLVGRLVRRLMFGKAS